jgi:hypothetical protein
MQSPRLGPLRITAPDDEYLGRLVKLIPAEVVALYLTFKEIATSWLSIWAWICLVLVVFVRSHGTRANKKAQKFAVLVSAVSFALWIYATGDYLIEFALPAGVVSVAVGVWTFIVPYFYKGDQSPAPADDA